MKRRKSSGRKLKNLYAALRNASIQKAEKESNWFVLIQMTAIDIMNEYLFNGVPHWFDLKTGHFAPKE